MSDFTPSVESVRSVARVTRGEYPPGMAGVVLSLEQIALRIREGATDPAVMGWAMDQLRTAGVDGRGFRDSAYQKMSVLLDAVRAAIVYTPDPPMTEYVKSAAAMLCLRPGLCVRGGDCFPEGTLLLRDDFEFVPIEQIRVGDRIWGRGAWTTVDRVWFKGELAVDAIEMNNGSTMYLTGDHKVYVRGDMDFVRVRVCELVVGLELLQPETVPKSTLLDPQRGRRPLAIKSIERRVRKIPCWDIATSDHYVYLPEHDVTVSNCDDHIILLGSVLMSVGIPVRVVKQTFGGDAQEHVLIEAQDDSGQWVALDPSTNYPPGRKASAMNEVSIDPLDPRMAGLAGKPEAEFIGVGAVPRSLRLPPRRIGVGENVVTTPVTVISNDPYAQSYTDLRNQMQAVVDAGDTYLGNGDKAGALSAYKAAGNAGAFSVGPEIDLSGAPLVTGSYTDEAWTTYQSLAATTDANTARVLVGHMIDLYAQAISQGKVAQSPDTAGLPPPPNPTPNPSIGASQVLPWVLGVGVVLGLTFMRDR